MWIAIVVLLASACGRIHFDPLGGAPGSDALAIEVCNGLDDDGDLDIDEMCPCTPFDVDIGPRALVTGNPPLIWTGDGYVTLVGGAGSVFAKRFTPDGVALADDPLSIPGTIAFGPDVAAWTGSALAVIATSNADVVVLKAAFGVSGGSSTRTGLATTPVAGDARIVWNRERFVIAWRATDGTVWTRELDVDLEPLGAATQLELTVTRFDAIAPLSTGLAMMVNSTTGADVVIVAPPDPAVQKRVHMFRINTQFDAGRLAVGPDDVVGASILSWVNLPGELLLASDTVDRIVTLPNVATTGDLSTAVTRSSAGFRVLEAAQVSLQDYRFAYVDVDAAGGVSAPSSITTFTTAASRPPTAVQAAGRYALVWNYGGNTFDTLRLIELCR